MTGKLKPYWKLLFQQDPVVPRSALLTTLCRLAWRRRTGASHPGAPVRCGSWILHSPDDRMLADQLKEKFILREYDPQYREDIRMIVDAGANIGISVLFFLARYPQATIHAFEPGSRPFSYLRKNVEANAAGRVRIYREALGEEPGEAWLHTPANRWINAKLRNEGEDTPEKKRDGAKPCILLSPAGKLVDADQTERVRVSRLSDFLRQHGPADLLKLDVEGAETAILQDLRRNGQLSPAHIACLVMEFHGGSPKAEQQWVYWEEQLVGAGYQVRVRHPYPGKTYSDRIIYATARKA